MAGNLIGSEIIKLGTEINERIRKGEKIFNYTIGDFTPELFPIPELLQHSVIKAYEEGHSNYPTANGIIELRQAVSSFLKKYESLDYHTDEILITCGARPGIYATFLTLVDPGDKVVYPVPSWNNNHYCHLVGAEGIQVETSAENHFMPSAADLRPHLQDAVLLSLCSPLNPTGTVFQQQQLEEICDLVLEENARRGPGEKPLYLLFDQIYWILTFGKTLHYNPVSLRPDMRRFTIFVDGISKSFAATGMRVGWTFGPEPVIDKMKSILSHVGAWSPKAEQVATARFLNDQAAIESFLVRFKENIEVRLQALYQGFMKMKAQGLPIDCITPQAAIYLTLSLALKGMITPEGKRLESNHEITSYILEQTGIAVVPFYAFGAAPESSWYRLSVGTTRLEDIPLALDRLQAALQKLKP